MSGEKNLIPQNKRTKEEQKEIARKGGIASGKVRREQKKYKELCKMLLGLQVSAKNKKLLEQMGVEDTDDMTQKTLTVFGIIKAAQEGNVKAFEKLQELTGETETKETNNGILDELAEFLKNE
jgi:NADH/NAD ratio-sensing transcriptional regulator Rex